MPSLAFLVMAKPEISTLVLVAYLDAIEHDASDAIGTLETLVIYINNLVYELGFTLNANHVIEKPTS